MAGATHLWLWFHGYAHAGVGLAFLVDAALSGAAAAWVAIRADRRAALAASLVAGAALFGYALARTVGLFGFVERSWTGASLLAATCEAVALVVLLTETLVPEPPVR